MQKETEIKLRVSRATLEALQEHPLLKKRNKSGWERRELYNQYYDTPAASWPGPGRAAHAPRRRAVHPDAEEPRAERGRAVRTQRVGLVPGKEQARPEETRRQVLAGGLKDLDKKQLKPIFSTDFVRQRAEIAWGRGKARVVVEAALDLGKVVAGDNQEEICELELELRQGDAAALLELAAELAADLPLMPCDISKAERGYRLFDPNSYEVDPRRRNCWRKPAGRCLRRHRLVPARQQPATGRTVSLQRPLAPAGGLAATPAGPAYPARQPRPGGATRQQSRAARSAGRSPRRLGAAHRARP